MKLEKVSINCVIDGRAFTIAYLKDRPTDNDCSECVANFNDKLCEVLPCCDLLSEMLGEEIIWEEVKSHVV